MRAISKATGDDWSTTYLHLCIQGYLDGDMPSANATWGRYLQSIGFKRYISPDCTVAEFADAHPKGIFILALSGHVVCIQDGTLYDSWYSGNEPVLYFWIKEN